MAPFANAERGCALETVKRLRPCYFGLCFVHMWIYCTTHRPSVSDELSTMAVMYLAQSAALVAMFLLARHSRGTGRQVAHVPQGLLRVADVASALCMSVCALVLAGAVPTGGALVAGVASGLGGIGVTWAYARWCQFYAKLDLRLAAPLVFATMAIGSAGKAVIDLLGTVPASAALAIIPWACFACAARANANPPQGTSEPRVYYNWRTVTSIARLAAGVAVFSFTFGMVQSVLLEGLPTPYHASVLVHHGSEIAIALLMVGWLMGLKRGLNFSRTWRIILVLMATALIFEPYIDAGASSFMLSLIRTAQTFLIIFLFLAIADVARHSSYNPVAIFAAGWFAYSFPFTVGKMVGDEMVSSGQSFMFVMSVVVWILIMVTIFVMDDAADGNRLIFAELSEGEDEDTPAKRIAAMHDELDSLTKAGGRAEATGRMAGAGKTGGADGAVRPGTGAPHAAAGEASATGTASGADAGAPSPALSQADYIRRRCDILSERYGLTRREGEILSLLVRGRSKAHIAEAFIISENTVRGHVKHIYAKLEIHNKQELLDLFEDMEC